jgi:heme a synthase
MKTLVEFSHRASSGILGPLVVILMVWAFRVGGGRHRWWSMVTAVFTCFEAALGAGLVLKELVADNDSVTRAIVVGLHLSNTLVLVAAASLTAWYGVGRPLPREGASSTASERRGAVLALVLVVLISITGAVTALGDTLFPVQPALDTAFLAHLREDLSPGAHFLVRLRVIHPLLAALGAGFILFLSTRWASSPDAEMAMLGRAVHGLTWTQLVVGTLNIVLGAPGWMQLIHLLCAQLLWVALVLVVASQRHTSLVARR